MGQKQNAYLQNLTQFRYCIGDLCLIQMCIAILYRLPWCKYSQIQNNSGSIKVNMSLLCLKGQVTILIRCEVGKRSLHVSKTKQKRQNNNNKTKQKKTKTKTKTSKQTNKHHKNVQIFLANSQYTKYPNVSLNLPHKVKTRYVYFQSHAEYSLLPWKISEEIRDNQCSSIL